MQDSFVSMILVWSLLSTLCPRICVDFWYFVWVFDLRYINEFL